MSLLFKLIVLTSQFRMQKERTISAIYHLLKGKQSIQTIQDAHLFQLEKYYGIYKNLTSQRFFEIVNKCEKDGLVVKEGHYYGVTTTGEYWLNNHKALLQELSLDGIKFRKMDQLFFSRLLLLIQVWTNSKMTHFKFIPIIEHKEVEQWVRLYYQKTKNNLDHYLHTLYEEFIRLLSSLPTSHTNIFINQLTGYKSFGLSLEQLATKYKMSKEDIHLITVSVLHFMLLSILENKEQYPLLYSFKEDLHKEDVLTDSAKVTKKLLQSGLTITQIANNRRLKENTIYDHIVEMAHNDQSFPLSTYVHLSAQQQIIRAVEQIQSFKLKDIKLAVSKEITYFQIRLVLARWNHFDKRREES